MVRFIAFFPRFRHIFLYTGASFVTACAIESYLPHSYREWLKIDEFKTSLLASDILEEESPFFEQYSSHETFLKIRQFLFDRLVTHIFDVDRSIEFYLAFFHTYGHGERGMERIAKLAIQRDLPENFKCAFETVYDARFNSFWDEDTLKEHLSQLLDRLDLTNDCIGQTRAKYTQKINDVDQWNDTERYHDLDIDRPVLQLTPISSAKQIQEQIKLIGQIVDVDDFVALHYLFEDGLIETLFQVHQTKPNLRGDIFSILSKLSSSTKFDKYLKTSNVLYAATTGLWSDSIETRSTCYKILYNLCYDNAIKSSVYVGHPKSVKSEFDFNLVFVHGLLGKSHRTWRAHDSIVDQKDHTECWPIEWLPTTLGKRSLKPRIILLSYSTSLSMHGQDCVDFVSIEDRAKLLLTDLQSLDLSKPIIMIGHSMGGLIMKSMLIQSDEQFRDKVKGMVFYSTPHFGSKLAGYASNPMISKILSPSTDVTELNDNAQHLPQLNEKFTNLVKGRKSFPILSFYEEKPINAYGQDILIVEPESANVGLGESVPIDDNHIYVNKPVSRSHPSYSFFVNFILKVLSS